MARTARPWYLTDRQRWCVVLDGRRITLAEGPKDATREEARRAFHRLMADRGAGKAPPGPDPPLVNLAAAYLAECNGAVARNEMARKTRDGYAEELKPLLATFGDRPATALTPRLLNAWLDDHPAWNTTTRHHYAATAKRLLRWAAKQRRIASNPLADLDLPRRRPRRPDVPSPADADVLLSAIRTPAFRDLCRFLLLTGARPGEAAALTAADVDLDAGIATLGNHKTAHRSGRARRVFLPPEAIDLCRRKIGEYPEGPIFPNARGRPWTTNACYCQLRTLRKKGLVPERVIVYGLRHLFATDALEAGESVATVAALLGNTPAMVEQTYSRLSDRDEHLRAAVNRVRPGRAMPPPRRPNRRKTVGSSKGQTPGANGSPGAPGGPSRDS